MDIPQFVDNLSTELKLKWFYRLNRTTAHLLWEGYSVSDVKTAISHISGMEAENGGNSVMDNDTFKLLVDGSLTLHNSTRDHSYRQLWPFSIFYRPKSEDFYKN